MGGLGGLNNCIIVELDTYIPGNIDFLLTYFMTGINSLISMNMV